MDSWRKGEVGKSLNLAFCDATDILDVVIILSSTSSPPYFCFWITLALEQEAVVEEAGAGGAGGTQEGHRGAGGTQRSYLLKV